MYHLLTLAGVLLLCINQFPYVIGVVKVFKSKQVSPFMKVWNLIEVALCIFALVILIVNHPF